MNGAEALAAIGDPARLAQILWSARLPTTIKVLTAGTGQPETPDLGVPHDSLIRGLLIDGKIIASDWLENVDSVKGRAGPHLVCGRLRAQERRLMVQVARALRLGVVRIDLLRLDRADGDPFQHVVNGAVHGLFDFRLRLVVSDSDLDHLAYLN